MEKGSNVKFYRSSGVVNSGVIVEVHRKYFMVMWKYEGKFEMFKNVKKSKCWRYRFYHAAWDRMNTKICYIPFLLMLIFLLFDDVIHIYNEKIRVSGITLLI